MFQSFDAAAAGYRDFLARNGLPTNMRWLVRSRVRCSRTSLYVFRPLELTDQQPHRLRFDRALALKRSIAFCCHGIFDNCSLVAAETSGLDETAREESACHNYQILESRLALRPLESIVDWQLVRMFVWNTHPMWNYLGWPP